MRCKYDHRHVNTQTTLLQQVCLYGSVHGLGCYATLVGIVTRHPDIAVLSPVRSPAVLEQPVVMAVLRAIASDDHRVGQFGAGTTGFTVDAISVELWTRDKGEENSKVTNAKSYK